MEFLYGAQVSAGGQGLIDNPHKAVSIPPTKSSRCRMDVPSFPAASLFLQPFSQLTCKTKYGDLAFSLKHIIMHTSTGNVQMQGFYIS